MSSSSTAQTSSGWALTDGFQRGEKGDGRVVVTEQSKVAADMSEESGNVKLTSGYRALKPCVVVAWM